MARRLRKQVTDSRPSPPKAPAPAPTLAMLRAELYALADPADAIHLQRFFKTAPGEYGAGDKFLGLRVPALRKLVRDYRQLNDADALEMLASSWHEERLLALMLLVDGYDRGDESRRERIHRAYLEHTRYINNWDLVDASAEHIVGRTWRRERSRFSSDWRNPTISGSDESRSSPRSTSSSGTSLRRP